MSWNTSVIFFFKLNIFLRIDIFYLLKYKIKMLKFTPTNVLAFPDYIFLKIPLILKD